LATHEVRPEGVKIVRRRSESILSGAPFEFARVAAQRAPRRFIEDGLFSIVPITSLYKVNSFQVPEYRLTGAYCKPDTSQKEVKQIVNLQFDEMISSPSRLAILAALVPGEPVCFTEMKEATGLTDGNLHVQTHKLANAGYLHISKARQGRRSVTEYRLTESGLERFRLHVRKLQKVLDVESATSRPALSSRRPDDSAVWS
jgi:DNA-binding transcriptional ArsR family regulator